MEMVKRLCIDIGNTRVKAAWFEGKSERFYRDLQLSELEDLIHLNPDIIAVAKSGVHQKIEYLIEQQAGVLFLDHNTSLPISLDYKTPETLGADRIAAASGANHLFEADHILVLDIGTCITLDLVSMNAFQGGLISPGIDMRFRAMHEFTAALPLVKFNDSVTFPGKSSMESMQLGVYQSIMNELNGYFGSLSEQYPDLLIVDASGFPLDFDKASNYKIFAQPNLVLYGLDVIAKYNA
jgi:type III pantothenate kinase